MKIPALSTRPGSAWIRSLTGNARVTLPVAVAVVAALVAVPVEYSNTHHPLEAFEALLAVAVAGAVAWLAASLPGVTAGGLVLGGFFATAGAVSWTYGAKVWGILLVGGVGFIAWSRPWVRPWTRLFRPAWRFGGAWLGIAYWIFGAVGAVLVGDPKMAAQRLLYAGVFGLAVFAALAATLDDRAGSIRDRASDTSEGGAGRDLSMGVACAFLIMIAVLLTTGSGNLFDEVHQTVKGAWGENQQFRFWGGPSLFYHPNSLAGIAVVAAIRIGPDRACAVWQRIAATALAGCIVYLTNSRTGVLFLTTAAVGHAVLLWQARRRAEPPATRRAERGLRRWLDVTGLPVYRGRKAVLAALFPFVVIALVLTCSGSGFLGQRRDEGGGMTSGRVDTWKAVGTEWRHAGIADKIFGDTQTVRAVVHRKSSGDVELTTDNAAVGAVRRGGVLGVLAFLLGLGLLVRRAFSRRVPAWFPIVVVAALPTIAVADWLLGGTGGTIWIMLVTGEALALRLRPSG